MDLQNLSKIKHIYRIYESEDEVLHCEKFPVIYINSKVVYFKDGRKQECLNYIYVKDVKDNFTKFYNYYFHNQYRPCFNNYFWNMETNVQEIYEDLKKQRELIRKNSEEKQKRDRLEKAKREYEAALLDMKLFDGSK